MAHFRTYLFYQFSTKKIQPVIHRMKFGDSERSRQPTLREMRRIRNCSPSLTCSASE